MRLRCVTFFFERSIHSTGSQKISALEDYYFSLLSFSFKSFQITSARKESHGVPFVQGVDEHIKDNVIVKTEETK